MSEEPSFPLHFFPAFRRLVSEIEGVVEIDFYTGVMRDFVDRMNKGVLWDCELLDQNLRRWVGDDQRILDLGGGSGRVTRYLAQRGWRVALVDSSEDQVHEARQALRGVARASVLPATDLCADVDLEDDVFGAALMSAGTLNCFTSEELATRLLGAVDRAVGPGGLLFLPIFADSALSDFTPLMNGATYAEPIKRRDGSTTVVWSSLRFVAEAERLYQVYYADCRSNAEGFQVFCKNTDRIWTPSTVTPLLETLGWAVVDYVPSVVQGGGAEGQEFILIVAEKSGVVCET